MNERDWVLVRPHPHPEVPGGQTRTADQPHLVSICTEQQILRPPWFHPPPSLCPPPVPPQSAVGVPAHVAKVTGSVLSQSEHKQDAAGALPTGTHLAADDAGELTESQPTGSAGGTAALRMLEEGRGKRQTFEKQFGSILEMGQERGKETRWTNTKIERRQCLWAGVQGQSRQTTGLT